MRSDAARHSTEPVTVFWFRRDLRLEDNHGLFRALESGLPVLPVFIFDTEILSELNDPADRQVNYIHAALTAIDRKLRQRGSSLLTLHGTPEECFRDLLRRYPVKFVYANHDYEPYAQHRDNKVQKMLQKEGIRMETFKNQVIFERSEITKADGTPYGVFTPYSRVWKSRLNETGLPNYPSEKHLSSLLQFSGHPFHGLEEIGFRKCSTPEPGYPPSTLIRNYADTRNIPGIEGSSRMSVHLRFGTISIRKLVAMAMKNSEPYLNELIWREFFMMLLFHFPETVTEPYNKKYKGFPWRRDPAGLEAWKRGETGYPIVDAGMKELNATGFMHNRVRMITAGFLVKHLLIDWREGEAWFAEKLMDYELSSNVGNWQWAAGCGCDAAPYFRIFNPDEQQKKFDPDNAYISKWTGNKHRERIIEHTFARDRALETYSNYLKGISIPKQPTLKYS